MLGKKEEKKEIETGTDGKLPESPVSRAALYACRMLTEYLLEYTELR